MWRVEYVLVCGDEVLPSFSTQLVVYHANMYGDRDDISFDVDRRVCACTSRVIVAPFSIQQ